MAKDLRVFGDTGDYRSEGVWDSERILQDPAVASFSKRDRNGR